MGVDNRHTKPTSESSIAKSTSSSQTVDQNSIPCRAISSLSCSMASMVICGEHQQHCETKHSTYYTPVGDELALIYNVLSTMRTNTEVKELYTTPCETHPCLYAQAYLQVPPLACWKVHLGQSSLHGRSPDLTTNVTSLLWPRYVPLNTALSL